jgi:tetratricopeptide (TPR) repeat protein
MAKPDRSETTRPPESAVSTADPATPDVEALPEVEPLTPERALEWNRYYDRYVAGGVILLVFLVSAHKINSSSSPIWPMLKVGEAIVKRGAPITTDVFSFTEQGRPWVNIPWLYEVGSHFLYTTGRSLFSADPVVGDQIGAGFLIGLNALVRALTVLIVLKLRRPGPGLWWFAIVTTVAMATVFGPNRAILEWNVGGIARQAILGPETWGHLLFALEILLIDRGLFRGKRAALYGLPPLFLAWANLDDTFAVGLVILLVSSAFALIPSRRREAATSPSPAIVGGIVLGGIAVCLANPSLWKIFPVAFEPITSIPRMVFSSGNLLSMPDHLSYFGRDSWVLVIDNSGVTAAWLRLGFYLTIVALGLASFLLSWRRDRIGRLAIYLAMAILWGGLNRLSAEFAVVFAYAVGLNGQEWYQARYGVAGRISPGWTAWSIVGRAVTIVVLFLLMARTLTGYAYENGAPTFGFSYDPSEFAFETAEYLKTAKINGQVMNLGDALGDAIIWKATPQRKTFIDRRRGLFGPDLRREIRGILRAFSYDAEKATIVEDAAAWRPILDKYDATAIAFEPALFPTLYEGTKLSKNWIPIRYDGRVIVLGRADAPKDDLAYFEANRLDAEQIVYHRKQSIPLPDRTPSATTVIDRVIRNRTLGTIQPHVTAGSYWLESSAAETKSIPDAAHCFMAIREARAALHYNADETNAYRLLDLAYDYLTRNEVEILARKATAAPTDYINFRTRQRVTALNYAIQTTPHPRTDEEKGDLANLHLRLARLFRQSGDLDFERDNLAAARDLVVAALFPPEELKRLEALDDNIEKFKEDLQKLTTDRNLTPMQRASRAQSYGFTGIALHELEDAESQGVSADEVLASIVNLDLRTGQPDRANEKLGGRPLEDRALYSGPGTPEFLNGLVNMLLGFYDNTVTFWRDKAIMKVRMSEGTQGLDVARRFLVGMPQEAVQTTLELTGQPGQSGLVETQAAWEFDLALCLLESGDPAEAGRHFTKALTLNPKLVTRPLIEDYLKKLGLPVPAAPQEDAKPDAEPGPKEKPDEVKPAAEK